MGDRIGVHPLGETSGPYNLILVPQEGFDPPTPHYELAAQFCEIISRSFMFLEEISFLDGSHFEVL
jgi:hypothetical protein